MAGKKRGPARIFPATWLTTTRHRLHEMQATPPPAPAHFSGQDAIAELAAEIVALQNRGYRLEDIATALSWDTDGAGAITSGALRSYLKRAKAADASQSNLVRKSEPTNSITGAKPSTKARAGIGTTGTAKFAKTPPESASSSSATASKTRMSADFEDSEV